MTAPPLAPSPTEHGDTAAAHATRTDRAARTSRAWVVTALLGALALASGVGLLVGALTGPDVVTPRFSGGDAVATDWGSVEAYGQPGSWVLGYVDGTTMTMAVPWSGGPVAEARLGEGPVDLATVVDHEVLGGELVTTIAFDGCDYFHERELQVFATMTVVAAGGTTTQVRFDRPLFVRSPMLWQCPDRQIDRFARNRSDL